MLSSTAIGIGLVLLITFLFLNGYRPQRSVEVTIETVKQVAASMITEAA